MGEGPVLEAGGALRWVSVVNREMKGRERGPEGEEDPNKSGTGRGRDVYAGTRASYIPGHKLG